MIDHTLVISPTGALLFHLKQGFWLYLWPMLIGFLTILGYQALGRVSMMGNTKWPTVFLLGSVVSMVSLFGWVTMVRGIHMIPFYGMGVGLASAIMSRVYAITLPMHPRLKMRVLSITWRGDKAGIERLKQTLKDRAASMEAARARV